MLGLHRKLVPTFTERLFWGQGDAPDMASGRLALTDEARTRAAYAHDVDPAEVVELTEKVRQTAG